MLVWNKNATTASAPTIFTLSLACFCISLGLLRTDFAQQRLNQSPLEQSLGQSVNLVGVVEREPEKRETSTHLYVTVDDDVLLVTTDRHAGVLYGDEVRIKGVLEQPKSFTTELGREFNYPGYLLAKGVEYKISFAEVEVLAASKGNPVINFLLVQKHRLMDGIEQVLQEPQAGLGEGLLLGVKQALGKELEEAFRTTGIIHIVVLSGYNVMLVVAFITFLFSFFLPRRARLFAGIVAIILFALIVGLSATVVRACIMASLLLIAQAYGRTYDVTRSLLFAGVVMVAIHPFLLVYDIGFQFSFMATVGLLLVAPRFEQLLVEGVPSIGVKEFFVATVATQIAVLPLLLYYIGEVSLIAVVVNVFVLPVVPAAMLTTFLAGIVALVSIPLALPIAFVAHSILLYITTVATFFATIPFATVGVSSVTVLWVFVLYAGMGGVLIWLAHKTQATPTLTKGWIIEEEKEPAKI